ncbi:VanZ family protein [Ilumatobacter sp.]|uniref:VanZ family protein n=1 Tax=Ilumatobacter sp. TaxID=1967498 RepID=UPI003B523FF7
MPASRRHEAYGTHRERETPAPRSCRRLSHSNGGASPSRTTPVAALPDLRCAVAMRSADDISPRRDTNRWRPLVAILPLVAVAAITLGPLPVRLLDLATDLTGWIASRVGLAPPSHPRRGQVEAALNLVVPAAAAILFHLGFPRVRPRSIALGGLATTLAIETLQLILPGRHPDLRDLVLNSCGVLLGVLLIAMVRHLAGATGRRADRG